MTLKKIIGLSLAASIYSGSTQALVLTNPAAIAPAGATEFGLYLGQSSTEYDLAKADDSGDIKRSFIKGYGAYGINDKISVFAGLSYGFSVEDGSGTKFGLGLKGGLGDLISITDLEINWYTQFAIYDEDLGESGDTGITTENSLSELTLGIVAVKAMSPDLKFYGGIELVASSSGETVAKKEFLDDYKSDMERSNTIGLRAGVNYKGLQAHIGLVDESSFMIGVTMPLEGFEFPKFNMGKDKKAAATPKPVEATPAAKPRVIEFDLYDESPKLNAREKLRLLQQKLTQQGFKLGVADGLMGKRTRTAIRAYQKKSGLPLTGKPDTATYKALGIK